MSPVWSYLLRTTILTMVVSVKKWVTCKADIVPVLQIRKLKPKEVKMPNHRHQPSYKYLNYTYKVVKPPSYSEMRHSMVMRGNGCRSSCERAAKRRRTIDMHLPRLVSNPGDRWMDTEVLHQVPFPASTCSPTSFCNTGCHGSELWEPPRLRS